MGRFKEELSGSDEEYQTQESDEEKLFPQRSPHDLEEGQRITRTRSGTIRRDLPKRNEKITSTSWKGKKQIKCEKEIIEQSTSPEHDIIDLKIEPDDNPDPDPKSDIEEDECIPNGCKSIECFICSCSLNKIYNLRLHMAEHLKEESYDMETLKKSEIFNMLNPHNRNIDLKTIRTFVIQEIQAKRYSQFYCILNEAAVELHISDSETDSDEAGDSIPRNNYRCGLCKKNFDRRYKALFHQKTCHIKDELVVECDYCLKKFVCMNLLIHHLKTQCENDEKPVPCTERFMKFLLKVNLEYYANLAEVREQKKLRKETDPPKSYTCNICKKTFTRQEHLNRHRAVHLPDEMKFECSICDRRFNRKDNMRSHMKTHTEEGARNAESKKVLCSYCGRSFSSKSNYVVHMRRHTGEKPYKCEVCGKGFPKSTDLNSHKITHTGERNFVCTICNKPFARSAVLSKHMRSHNGPYPCTYCDKKFLKPIALTVHCRTEHNVGPHRNCFVCKEFLATKIELDAHFADTGHNNEPKEVKVAKETIVVVKGLLKEPLPPLAEQLSDAAKRKTSDDPLQIDEDEWRSKKVKLPINEAIQNVLQKSTNTAVFDSDKKIAQKIEDVMPPFSPIDSELDDDTQYNDW